MTASRPTRRGVAWTARAFRARRLLPLALALPLLIAFAGCDWQDDKCSCPVVDTQPPAAPRGLYSVTGDGRVTLGWLSNTEPDVKGYYVWWSESFTGSPYHLLAQVLTCRDCYWMEYVHTGAGNGRTLYYAVSAYDEAGHESELSQEEVWDTPRPEGHAAIANARDPIGYASAGFDLHGRSVLPADSPAVDFYYLYYDEGSGGYLVAGSEYYEAETTEIQDMGYTAGLDEIDFAPDDAGWSPTGTAEPVLGHTYVLLTRDGHYAKIRLTYVGPERVSFDWAHQLVPWNRQLSAPEGR